MCHHNLEISTDHIKVITQAEALDISSEAPAPSESEIETQELNISRRNPGHGTPDRFRPERGPSHGSGPALGPARRGRPFHSPPEMLPGRAGRLRPERSALAGCMGRTMYVWLRCGRSFWFYPEYIGRSTLAGYAWTHGRWTYTGFSIFSVEFFVKL